VGRSRVDGVIEGMNRLDNVNDACHQSIVRMSCTLVDVLPTLVSAKSGVEVHLLRITVFANIVWTRMLFLLRLFM
jgi:hypothetical protein